MEPTICLGVQQPHAALIAVEAIGGWDVADLGPLESRELGQVDLIVCALPGTVRDIVGEAQADIFRADNPERVEEFDELHALMGCRVAWAKIAGIAPTRPGYTIAFGRVVPLPHEQRLREDGEPGIFLS